MQSPGALDDMWLRPKVHDLDAYRSSLEWFAKRRTAGDQAFFSHDANFWRSVSTGEPWAGSRPLTSQVPTGDHVN